ncbi:uncharacterized protein LOC132549703 [Ylistrum balloti]|uniref:uncharacterized protein LOC132549703 n=1 Tax=Ylistrum balloti TaxID=509963 RepID=UPI002905A7FD|nr:uncharacterized protein LOC132549703 [Ylistrum balloti]
MMFYIISRLLAVSLFITLSHCQDGRIFECTDENVNDSKKTLHVRCSDDKVIRINEAIYGLNQLKYCMYTVGDCIENINLDDECCGRRQCDVTIWRVFSAKCGHYVSFFRLIYDCIPAYKSDCAVYVDPDDLSTNPLHTSTLPNTTSTQIDMFPPVTAITDPLRPKKESTLPENEDREDLTIILGSAALVALLLAAILSVIFMLRKYQWQSEKQCVLSMFVGMCTRQPPDGCEDPDGSIQHMSQHGHSVSVHPVTTDREANNNQDNETVPQTVLTVESDISDNNQNKENAQEETQDYTPPSKRKRKRNEPSPDIQIGYDSKLRESPALLDEQMSLYNRNILFSNKTVGKQIAVNEGEDVRHLQHVITQTKDNHRPSPRALNEKTGTTAV